MNDHNSKNSKIEFTKTITDIEQFVTPDKADEILSFGLYFLKQGSLYTLDMFERLYKHMSVSLPADAPSGLLDFVSTLKDMKTFQPLLDKPQTSAPFVLLVSILKSFKSLFFFKSYFNLTEDSLPAWSYIRTILTNVMAARSDKDKARLEDYLTVEELRKKPEAETAIIEYLKKRTGDGYINLGDIDLSGAQLSGVNLQGANLENADLQGANLQYAHLGGTNLKEANLQGAHLGGAQLKDTQLEGARLGGANLEEVNLEEANLKGAHFYGTNIQGVRLQGANLDNVDFRVAIYKSMILQLSDVTYDTRFREKSSLKFNEIDFEKDYTDKDNQEELIKGLKEDLRLLCSHPDISYLCCQLATQIVKTGNTDLIMAVNSDRDIFTHRHFPTLKTGLNRFFSSDSIFQTQSDAQKIISNGLKGLKLLTNPDLDGSTELDTMRSLSGNQSSFPGQ